MPDWITAICLGIIEGVTEFLPISSTGHLLLAENWLPRQSDLFNTVVQSGAVLAVVAIFTRRIRSFIFEWRTPECRDYLFKLATAFAITGAGGLIMKKFGFELPESAVPVAVATLVGGVLILFIERWIRSRPATDAITWNVAALIGAAQLLAAMFPGASRSGVTIMAALMVGVKRPAATEFSFLLGIPTLLAAGGLQVFSALRDESAAPIAWSMIALSSVVAAVTAFAVVNWLIRFVQTHTFVGFAWYRIVLGTIMLALIR
ncbi:MAG: undecaprenyl-diphosphate phosphatase [Verrucomicrobia bacterium]|nr:undecaprenyl-diphosphate phosphatase [Verrucomicrobiota bacterium]